MCCPYVFYRSLGFLFLFCRYPEHLNIDIFIGQVKRDRSTGSQNHTSSKAYHLVGNPMNGFKKFLKMIYKKNCPRLSLTPKPPRSAPRCLVDPGGSIDRKMIEKSKIHQNLQDPIKIYLDDSASRACQIQLQPILRKPVD